MAQSKASPAEPVCIEASVSASADGKVAIVDYGKHSSGWSIFFSRKYAIPEGMTEDELDAFQLDKRDHLREIVDALDTAEYEERIGQANWNG